MLPWPLMQQAARDILEGVWHLNWYGVVHRDLKLDNVMVEDPAVTSTLDTLKASGSPSDVAWTPDRASASRAIGFPRFVLIDLGCSFSLGADPPEQVYCPPVHALADEATEPARCRVIRAALNDTVLAEVSDPGGNPEHLSPEVRNGWAAG